MHIFFEVVQLMNDSHFKITSTVRKDFGSFVESLFPKLPYNYLTTLPELQVISPFELKTELQYVQTDEIQVKQGFCTAVKLLPGVQTKGQHAKDIKREYSNFCLEFLLPQTKETDSPLLNNFKKIEKLITKNQYDTLLCLMHFEGSTAVPNKSTKAKIDSFAKIFGNLNATEKAYAMLKLAPLFASEAETIDSDNLPGYSKSIPECHWSNSTEENAMDEQEFDYEVTQNFIEVQNSDSLERVWITLDERNFTDTLLAAGQMGQLIDGNLNTDLTLDHEIAFRRAHNPMERPRSEILSAKIYQRITPRTFMK